MEASEGDARIGDTRDDERHHDDKWTPVFYFTVYVDADQVIKPWLKPRGERTEGPYETYEDAERMARMNSCTHYEVSRKTVKAGIKVPFKKVPEGLTD